MLLHMEYYIDVCYCMLSHTPPDGLTGNVQVVTVLLDHGANPLHRGEDDETPLDIAIRNGQQLCLHQSYYVFINPTGIFVS